MSKIFISLIVLMTASIASSAVISLDFSNGATYMSDPNWTAGVVSVPNWNAATAYIEGNVNGEFAPLGTTDLANLVDDNGNSTGVSVDLSPYEGYVYRGSNPYTFGSQDDPMMMQGYIYVPWGGLAGVTFDNIPYNRYDVYVYCLNENITPYWMTKITVAGNQYYSLGSDTNWANTGYEVASHATYVDAIENLSNTIVFRGIEGASMLVQILGESEARVNGIQIVNTEVYPVTPDSGEMYVETDVVFEWGDETGYTLPTYDIYVDPNASKVAAKDPTCEIAATGLTALSFDPSTDLSYDMTYYWNVFANAGAPDPNVFQSDVWEFVTEPAGNYVVITDQPKDTTADLDGNAELSVSVVANGLTNYQWYKYVDGGADVLVGEGAAMSTLQLTGVLTAVDEGVYYCKLITDAPVDTDFVQVWARRQMAHWSFDGPTPLNDTVDGWVGVYSGLGDPNYHNTGDAFGDSLDLRVNQEIVTVTDSGEWFNFFKNGFTFNYWLKYDTLVGTGYAVSKYESDLTAGVAAGRGDGLASGTAKTGNVYGEAVASVDILSFDTWHMVTFQLDPADGYLKLFVDGEFVAQNGPVVFPLAAGSEELVLGAKDILKTNTFKAILDEVGIWSYALSPAEIATLYTDIIDAVICTDPDAAMDLDGNCKVDLSDFAMFAKTWLNCRNIPGCM